MKSLFLILAFAVGCGLYAARDVRVVGYVASAEECFSKYRPDADKCRKGPKDAEADCLAGVRIMVNLCREDARIEWGIVDAGMESGDL